ncbi:ExeA family protein [Tautonia rosea]|uniref:ExeA family protein n=1 Tax=Tautonia rosea TaxID=2728037 RepID=UPI0028F41D3F|nr:AAA family ATPase [Tautonia rosea]
MDGLDGPLTDGLRPFREFLVYLDHFGLTALPFAESTSTEVLVPLSTRDAARRRLRYGLEQGQGPVLLFGPPGSGKTVVAASLARELGGRTIHLSYPAMPAPQFLAFLADELDGLHRVPGAEAPGLHATLRRLRTQLAGPASRGKPVLVIVDEAQLIDDRGTFEALRLLQNFSSAGPPDLRLMIVGSPEVLLTLPPSLADRLTARYALGSMTEEESAAYVVGRLEKAGARLPLFDDEQLSAMHLHAEGLPRRLNRLADLTLLMAFAEGLDRPDARCLDIAVRDACPDPLLA